jgi:hypothetical protein
MSTRAGYENLKWTFKSPIHMNKFAIVSESSVWGCLAAVDSPFGKLAGIGEKHFQTSGLQYAWNWINE